MLNGHYIALQPAEFLKKLAEGEGEENFWEKVVSDGIRNLEWEVKNREHFAP